MKKQLLSVLLLASSHLLFAQTKWAHRVLEFLPAPGQFTNEKAYPAYTSGDDAVAMAQKATLILQGNASAGTGNNMSTISLGAYGGYIIVGFDHSVLNKPYAYDLKIHGNWFDGNAESGIVMVSKDENNNGLADDAWYELAGSEYYHPSTIHHYEMTYFRPSPLDGNVRWADNQGKIGFVLRNSFHLQESYYPLWYDGDKLTFKGTKMMSNAWNTALPPQQYWRSESFAYGYADNKGNASELSNFDIDWAVDIKGNKVKLDRIDFVKVYTALIQDAGWLGETSTEFSQAEDVHPNYSFPPKFRSDVHIVKRLPTLDPSSTWLGTGTTSFTDDTVAFHSSFENTVLRDGFTYTNLSFGAFASANGKGVKGTGTTYLVGAVDAEAADAQNRRITFIDGLPHGLEGVYVNNTVASLSLLRQNMLAGDYVNLMAQGFDSEGSLTGTTEFKLADYQLENSVMHYLVQEWCWMDLSALGSVSSVAFSFEASRPEIVPTTFCLDQFTFDILSITKHPIGNAGGSPKLCENVPYTLSAEASGAGIGYQWYKNDTLLVGSTAKNLEFAALKKNHSGNYYCVVSNGKNKARTKEAQLTVYKNTHITQNLTGDTIKVPQTQMVTASIKVEGDNLVYQWYKGNLLYPNNPYQLVAIALNSTSKSPDFVPAQYGFIAEHDGAYYCQVNGSCGNVRSDTTAYKVVSNPNLPALVILKQPKDTSLCFGNTLLFEVDAPAATGYAWMKKTPAGTFAALGASLKKQITIANVVADGEYRCTVKQDTQSIFTDTIQVKVVQKLAFIQPADMTHLASYTAIQHKPLKMEVSALDFVPAAYQWYYKSLSDVEFIKLEGVTSARYTLEYPLPADAGKYRCEVTGALGKSLIEYSLSVVSSIAEPPMANDYINSDGTDGDVRESGLFVQGEHAKLTAYVLDGHAFKWYKDDIEIVVSAENQGIVEDTDVASGYWTNQDYPSYLFIKNIQKEYAGSYVLETINELGEVEERSAPIQLIMDPEKPEITNVLANVLAKEDDTAKLTIQVNGKGFVPSYQWYQNGIALMGGTLSPFVTTGPAKATFDFIVKPSSVGTYYCIVTTPGGRDTSNAITVSVQVKARIVRHPSDQIVKKGSTATFNVLAEGQNLRYQWTKAGIPIPQATQATLRLTQVGTADEALYTCVVKGDVVLEAESGPAELAVIEKPIISGNGICKGETETILRTQAQIKSVQVRYQWFKDQKAISGATYNWIKLSQAATDLSTYYCVVANGTGIASDTVSLVKSPPVVSSQPIALTTVKENALVNLSFVANGKSVRYQWYKDNVLMDGATSPVLSFSAKKEDEGVYVCQATNACGDVSSQTAQVRIELVTDLYTTETNQGISLYPNPAENEITLLAEAGSTLEILDLTGKVLCSQKLESPSTTLSLNNMESGLYAVHIHCQGTYRVLKFIKK